MPRTRHYTFQLPPQAPLIAHLFQDLSAPPNASESGVVQPAISEAILKVNLLLEEKKAPVRLADTYKKVSFHNRKPDIVVYPKEQVIDPKRLPAAYFIVCVGDVKGRRVDASFTTEEQGELESFLSELLVLFPTRDFVIGFLTDGHHVLFMSLTRLRSLYLSPVMLLKGPDGCDGAGARHLAALLFASPLDLGANVAPITMEAEQLVMEKRLGFGSSAVVWQVREFVTS